MSQQEIQLPPEAITLLKKIQQKHEITLEALKREVIQKYNSKKFFHDDKTRTLEQKLFFCTKTVKGYYDNLIPYKDYSVVPTGIAPIRVYKSGTKSSEIHVWTREKNNTNTLRAIRVTDEQVEKLNQIQIFKVYKDIKLGRFSSGDFSADHRTIFQNPGIVNIAPLEIYKKLNIKRCKIAELLSNVAKKEGKYDKTTDCRIVRGIIIKHGKGSKVTDSGTIKDWAYYDIFDASLDEDIVDPDGVVLKTILHVWVHPMWMTYERDNEIDFIGPISNWDKNISMNAYTLLPVYTPSGKITEE